MIHNNNKALSSTLAVIIVVVILLVAVVGIISLGSTPEAVNSDIKVYIDTVEQTVNITDAQTLDWGSITAGNTYTKNFTVANYGTSPYSIILLTTEPAGSSQTWSTYNNTILPAGNYAAGTLTLALSLSPSSGSYTWRLIASNSTLPTATPTVNPSATPTPNTIEVTVGADEYFESIAISKNNAAPYIVTDYPFTFTCTDGDDLKFTPTFTEGYTLNGWALNDGSLPVTTATLTIVNVSGNFTVMATSKTVPTV